MPDRATALKVWEGGERKRSLEGDQGTTLGSKQY